ncbi:MAG: hypothetical protein KGL44_11080 [Sphingomonadales bacterium]|nr:hypothetical protein [Sphingomonadales bacterium]
MAESPLVKIARQGGGRLVDLAVGRMLPESSADPAIRPGLVKKLAGAAMVRLATRSVPGAIVVTGGLIAKRLYDRRHARKAAASGAGSADKAPDKR